MAGKTHGDGEDSEIELKRKRQRVLENQRNRRRHAKLKAREQNARPPRPLAVVKALDWQTELAPGKEFDSKAELLLAAAEYSESVGACFKTSAKHPLAGGHGAQGCTTESKICLVCTSTKCMFCITARGPGDLLGKNNWSITSFTKHNYGCDSHVPPQPPILNDDNTDAGPSCAPDSGLLLTTAEPNSALSPAIAPPNSPGSPNKRRRRSPKKCGRGGSRCAYSNEQLAGIIVNAKKDTSVSVTSKEAVGSLVNTIYTSLPSSTLGRVIELAQERLRGVPWSLLSKKNVHWVRKKKRFCRRKSGYRHVVHVYHEAIVPASIEYF